mmetsp:Transcript_15267/g.11100  ORF Transcript_15267/g.11100 Transcript_15267/m.11100 type:complete len:86 (+) Transcript_15267:169-426(+)
MDMRICYMVDRLKVSICFTTCENLFSECLFVGDGLAGSDFIVVERIFVALEVLGWVEETKLRALSQGTSHSDASILFLDDKFRFV